MVNIGRAIRRIRMSKGLTQTEVAERAGVDQAYITMLERGKRKNPTLIVLERIADALRVELRDLLR